MVSPWAGIQESLCDRGNARWIKNYTLCHAVVLNLAMLAFPRPNFPILAIPGLQINDSQKLMVPGYGTA